MDDETIGITTSLETKDQVYDYIKSHPGTHLRQIKRELQLSMGVVQYHLITLEKNKRILSRRGGLYKRFYPALVFSEREQEVLGILSQETERDLVIYLLHHPKSTNKELSEYAQLSPGTINWHMKRLIFSKLVGVQRDGQFARYFVNAEKEEIIPLIREYHPSTWANWVDRFSNALGEISSIDRTDEKGGSVRSEETKE